MSETVEKMVETLMDGRDEGTLIVLVKRQLYALRVERLDTPEKTEKATEELKETFHERSI